MQQYGRNIVWGTAGVGNILGGICENFRVNKQFDETDEPDEVGDHAAHILSNRRDELSWASKLIGGGKIPIIGGDGGCRITVSGFPNVLLSSVTESGGNNQPRKLQLNATSYPDLLAPIGGADAVLTNIVIPPSAGALIYPNATVYFGTPDLKVSWGLIQNFTNTQQVKHNPISEDGKYRVVIVNGWEILFTLEVAMFLDQPAPEPGQVLTLDNPPSWFKTKNYIKEASLQYTINDKAVYSVTSRWTPVMEMAA